MAMRGMETRVLGRALLVLSLLFTACSHFVAYQERGGLTIVYLDRATRLEREAWDDFKSGVYGGVSRSDVQMPTVVALKPKELLHKFLEQSQQQEGAWIREKLDRGLGGFYNRSTKTVYYKAGHYRVLRHEYCHYWHDVRGDYFATPEDEERTCL